MAPSAYSWKNKRGFTTREAGEYIGRSASWLRKKRLRGTEDPGDPGPPYLKTDGGSAIYLKEDLDAWLDSHARRNAGVSESAASARVEIRTCPDKPKNSAAA
jgi:hypothetical protein